MDAGAVWASSGRIPVFLSRMMDSSAIFRAWARLAGESKSTCSPSQSASGDHPASSSPSSAFCTSTRRTAVSSTWALSRPSDTAWARLRKALVSGSSTSIPAASEMMPASSWSLAMRCMVSRKLMAQ
ncbi:hypothetical protein D3C74_314910 [compost metagenome]